MENRNSTDRLSAMSVVIVIFIGGAVLCAAATGSMREISDASFNAAKDAVSLAISLIGIMALWLGLVRILEVGGFMHTLARFLHPVMAKLFPEIPREHPAMSAMVLNISANMLGLGNAATPLGIKAMTELNRINPIQGTATNAMCLFVALHTSSITLFPLGTIGVRAAAGAQNPANIFLPTLISSIIATVSGCAIAMFLAKRDKGYIDEVASTKLDIEFQVQEEQKETPLQDFSSLKQETNSKRKFVAFALILLLFFTMLARALNTESLISFLRDDLLSYWLIPILMLLILSYGLYTGVKLYEAVTDGAKQGFEVAIRIIPFLVIILVSIAMFRASGAMDFVAQILAPFTTMIGMPAEVLPMALVRPLSGSGAFAIMSSIVQQDPNSYSAFLASVIQGAMDTTFYIVAIYFGAVKVSRVRHAIIAGLSADIIGIIAACFVSAFFWGL
ncbi:MAG: spore maturation protein [SAR324 cluster bacterium]|uniref:Spore maturation protein n=1 Tax=SAR324 cluster bacterium TaxID=2024889 RepID=A0A7X9FPP8_9DELT|nr:spore maturation protein [SAR324 cluster bacterium]